MTNWAERYEMTWVQTVPPSQLCQMVFNTHKLLSASLTQCWVIRQMVCQSVLEPSLAFSPSELFCAQSFIQDRRKEVQGNFEEMSTFRKEGWWRSSALISDAQWRGALLHTSLVLCMSQIEEELILCCLTLQNAVIPTWFSLSARRPIQKTWNVV